MNLFDQLAEKKIKEALLRGDFDNLSNHGKRMNVEDYSLIPEEKRMAYKILKNSGHLPQEIIIKNEISKLELSLMEKTYKDNIHIHKKIQYLLIQLEVAQGSNLQFFVQNDYQQKIIKKITVRTG